MRYEWMVLWFCHRYDLSLCRFLILYRLLIGYGKYFVGLKNYLLASAELMGKKVEIIGKDPRVHISNALEPW